MIFGEGKGNVAVAVRFPDIGFSKYSGKAVGDVRKRRHSPSMAQSRLCLPSGQTIADSERNTKKIQYPSKITATAIVFPCSAENSMGDDGRASVQLIAEKGKEDFYTRKGFKLIPHEFCGTGMRKIIRK